MLNMSQINCIRDRRKEGYSIAQIAREFHVDEKTVRKYLEKDDFSPRIPETVAKSSKLDQYKERVLEWLTEDEKNWHKQKHTALRIHRRLQENFEDYDCSYVTVQRFVKATREKRSEMRAYQELVWHAGESQIDFGQSDCYERGALGRKHCLTLVFPHSNASVNQMFNGEAAECVCQGLQDIFEFLGGVAILVVADNASGIGRRIGTVIRESKLFQQFRAHYGFSLRYCNPNSGHEKGCVENKVGTIRRNMFVPLPEFDDLVQFNRTLLERSKEDLETKHYKKGISVAELLEMDKAALLPLPERPFDVCRYEYCKADGYGKVAVDGNHHYSTRPEYAGREVLVGIRAHTIDIYDSGKEVLVSHIRRFGKERTDSIDYRTSLSVLMRNVGAWPNSGVREMMPSSIRTYFDSMERDTLKDALRTLNLLSRNYSFERALEAFGMAIRNPGRTPFCDAAVFAARLADVGLGEEFQCSPDLAVYDQFLTREAQ